MAVFDYFIHEASGDYFSGQSYTGIEFSDIPSPILKGSSQTVRDQIDFRPAVGELATGQGIIGSPFEVTCATLDFDARQFSTTGQVQVLQQQRHCLIFLRQKQNSVVTLITTYLGQINYS